MPHFGTSCHAVSTRPDTPPTAGITARDGRRSLFGHSGLAHAVEKALQLGQMGRVIAHRRPGGAGARDGESRIERETGLD